MGTPSQVRAKLCAIALVSGLVIFSLGATASRIQAEEMVASCVDLSEPARSVVSIVRYFDKPRHDSAGEEIVGERATGGFYTSPRLLVTAAHFTNDLPTQGRQEAELRQASQDGEPGTTVRVQPPLAVPAANSSPNLCRTLSAMEHHPSPAQAARVESVAGPDPLEIITVGPAVDLTDYVEFQRQIIVSLPLSLPPVPEGEEDEDQGSLASEDYVDFEGTRVPRWIVDTVLRASEVTGADPVYMMALADKESSFIPANKATTSSAEGLFQFITSTWLEVLRSFGPKHGLIEEARVIKFVDGKLAVQDETMREHILGLRRSPYISALMAAEMMKRNKAKIESRLGRNLSQSEYYLSHFFGTDSASKFIALVDDTPQKSAPDAFPAAAKANKSLFFAKKGKKTRQLSVAEVYGKIDSMINKRLDRYSTVSTRSADASF
jgi:hypothetical protein